MTRTFEPLPARTEYLALQVTGAGLRCGEAVYPAGLSLREHAHENACVTMVLEGMVEERCQSLRPVAVTPGTLVVRPWGVPHTDRVSERGVRLLEVELGAGWAGNAALRDTLRVPLMVAHPRLQEVSQTLREEMRRRDAASGLVLEGLGLELLGLALRLGGDDQRRPPRWLLDVQARLEAQFREAIGLEELARQAGVHPVHLARAFRRHLGTSPGGYVRRLRIRWAAEALRARPDAALADIAVEAGFYDHSHFTRAFKALMGTTPERHRQRS